MESVRRRKGDGYRRADGRWVVRAKVGTRSRVFYGRTLGEARRKAEDATGEWQPTETGTVAAFLTDWLTEGHDSLKPQTWSRYEVIVRRHLIPWIGDLQLSKVTESTVRDLQAQLRRGKLGDTSRHHVHAVLGAALEAARRRGLIQTNPAHSVPAPRMHHRPKQILTEAEARRLLDAARGTEYEPLFVLALTTGARVGELLALSWRDVDLEGARLSIRGTAVTGFDGTREISDPKTARGRRVVPLPPMTVAALAAYRAHAGEDAELLFPGRGGGVLAASTIRRDHFYPLLERAGLPRMTFHSLRDTAATLMLQRGVSAHVVSFILGHASVSTTLSIYAHVTRGLEAQATAEIQSIYGDRA